MSANIEIVTDASFDEKVKQSDLPVLVDFWAPWCGPCRMVTPILEEVAGAYAGRIRVVKVNVDDETKIASSMGIRSIPTIALFKNGEVLDTALGLRPKEFFFQMVDKALEG